MNQWGIRHGTLSLALAVGHSDSDPAADLGLRRAQLTLAHFTAAIAADPKLASAYFHRGDAKFRNENIGFIFQFHFLLPEFTAIENVMMPALKLGKYSRDKVEEMALDKLRQMDMHSFAKTPSGKLSGGQQQRVAIARALINDPLIIMADEPTGNLDSGNSNIVFDIFQNLTRNNGNTIITVTHDTDFAHKADRIIELVDGRLAK